MLPRLPDTAQELRSIASTVGDDDNRHIYLGVDASESMVDNLNKAGVLKDYRAISFATHGLVREQLPGLNEMALVLTPQRDDISIDDGLLTASEIADLNLNASLVILSACNTANFDLSLFGSEIYGLTTAFAWAGVPATLVTLWPVETQTSRILMTRLFQNMQDPSYGEVARAANRSIVAFIDNTPDRAYAHPRFWAPFVIFGDGAVRPTEQLERSRPGYRLLSLQVGSDKEGGEVMSLAKDSTSNSIYATGIVGSELLDVLYSKSNATRKACFRRTSHSGNNKTPSWQKPKTISTFSF